MDSAQKILTQVQDEYCAFVADSDATPQEGLLTDTLALENAWKVVATQKILGHLNSRQTLSNGSQVIDLGCGRGRYLMLLRAISGCEAYGLDDFGEGTHDYDQIFETGNRHGIQFVRGNVTKTLPYEDASADLVTSFNTLEHLHESPRQVMAEVYRVLKPGGVCVLGLPNLLALYKRIRFVAGRTCMPDFNYWWSSFPWRGHIRESAPGEVHSILQKSGFQAGPEIGFDAELRYKMGRLPYALYDTVRRLSSAGLSDCIFCGGVKR